MMFQIKTGITHDNVHDPFSDFYTKLDGSVNRHAPFKKLSPKEIKIKKNMVKSYN